MSSAGEQWRGLPARRRGALVRAVRRGDLVGEPDRALAVAVADSELTRLRGISPRRLLVARAVQGAVAALLALVTAVYVSAGRWPAVVAYGAGTVLFGTSALLARRRLDRQVARLELARERNASQGTHTTV